MSNTLRPPYAGSWEVPDGVTYAWGARLIITQDGSTDLLWDRQGATDSTPEAWHVLGDWLDGGAIKRAREVLSRMLRDYALSTREDRDVTLVDDGTGTIRGNPRASAGYCYVVGYLLPTTTTNTHEERP
jgi:hypothetical protein